MNWTYVKVDNLLNNKQQQLEITNKKINWNKSTIKESIVIIIILHM